jgi:hypothetical protein
MNDVTYVETSRALAQRMMREGGTTPEQRIGFAFRLATARSPRQKENEILLNSYRHYLATFDTDRKSAANLLAEGESPRDPSLDPTDLAAYTSVASLILNLDETVTKE